MVELMCLVGLLPLECLLGRSHLDTHAQVSWMGIIRHWNYLIVLV